MSEKSKKETINGTKDQDNGSAGQQDYSSGQPGGSMYHDAGSAGSTTAGQDEHSRNKDTAGKGEQARRSDQDESAFDTFYSKDSSGDSGEEDQQTRSHEKTSEDRDQQIADLEQKLADTREAMLRKAAEFENLKKRTQKEKARL